MATPGSPTVSAPPVSLHRRVSFALFAGLVALAAAFYVWWGLAYGGWLDNGVYAVSIVLAGFGLAGMWLVLPSAPSPSPPRP
jgi:hypothetical protein